MRILIFTAYYLPHIGGYTLDTHELAKQINADVDVVTCNTNYSADEEIIDGVKVYRLPCWQVLPGEYAIPKPTIKTAKVLYKLFKKDYDIISTQSRLFVTSLLGAVFAKLKRTPHVHTERGAAHSVSSRKFVSLLGRFYDHTLGALTSLMASERVGVSDTACKFMKHLGIKSAIRIPNGVDDLFFNELRKASDGKHNIIFAGRLSYGKGVHDLIKSLAGIDEIFSDIKLVVVGDGSYREDLEKLASQECKVATQFLGSLSRAKLAEVLPTATIFVNPSYSEGLPSSVSEAMAVGLPVVATDVGGTRELVEDGVTGYLVQPGDVKQLRQRVMRLLLNDSLAFDMGQAGRAKVLKEYRWSSVIEKYARLFQRLTEY